MTLNFFEDITGSVASIHVDFVPVTSTLLSSYSGLSNPGGHKEMSSILADK